MTSIVVDTSALVAIVKAEPDSIRLSQAMTRAETVVVPATTVLEARIVLMNHVGEAGRKALDALLEDIGATVVPLGHREMERATEGHARFGRGRHPAALNFGDCLVYGTARALGLPLLFVGNDFAQTDLAVARY